MTEQLLLIDKIKFLRNSWEFSRATYRWALSAQAPNP